MVNILQQLIDEAKDILERQLRRSTAGGGVRIIDEEEPQPERYGPIVKYLIDQGYIQDPRVEDIDREEFRSQLENVPDSAFEAAERATREVTGQTMEYTEFISVGLDQCGADQETFKALARLWSEDKATIRQMSESELRRELNCP